MFTVICQGYLQLLEPEVTIVSRKKDKKIVERAAEGARRQYKEISGNDVEFTVDNSFSDTTYVLDACWMYVVCSRIGTQAWWREGYLRHW